MGKARAPRAPAAEPTEVEVRYDLFDLPTAFHKAGLAGLVLLIESLKARHQLTDDEAQYTATATCATVTFTKTLLRKLMDELYDARVVEVAVRSKWPGAVVKREEMVEEEVNGKMTRTKRFIYDQVQPKGSFFDNVFDGDKEVWRKLWRDMIWNIPRGRPMTREPFNQRAENKECKEGASAWEEMLKVRKARDRNEFHTAELSSALFPGAQAVNAESIPFEGRAEHNLLLHFWPLVVLLFVPQVIESDGSSDFVGCTLAVPEVSNLTGFVGEYPKLLAAFTGNVRGYRPAQAVIDLPAEGALAFFDDLAVLAGLNVEQGELRFSLGGVEYLHLAKVGNNIKAMGAGRVAPNRRLLTGYRNIVTPPDESARVRNPLFRRGLLVALLDNLPWYRPFGRTFREFEDAVFIRQPRRAEDKGPPQFADDAARKLRADTRLYTATLKRTEEMPDAPRPPAPPPVIVNRVVRNYLLARAQEKSGVTLATGDDEPIDWKAVPKEFNEAKQKLAQSLFLEFRSRRDQAFTDLFAATFFSTTQRLSEPDRLELSDLLLKSDRRDDLKTLTLLALSANS